MSTQPPMTRAGDANGVAHRLRSGRGLDPQADANSAGHVSDELAALFLGEPSQEPERSTPDPEPKARRTSDGEHAKQRVSLLVLGNLPVFAGAWATQYARDRHDAADRPLGLLTLGDEAARLEAFGIGGRPHGQGDALADALQTLGRLGADLLVRLPEAEAGWIGGDRVVSNLTLLTGADDPAIVAAYRSLKSIVQDLPTDARAPELHVCIAGSPAAVAREAAEKLAQASTRFLGLEVGPESPVQQIDAGASVELFHGSPPAWADVPDLLAHFVRQRPAPVVESVPVEGQPLEPRRSSQPVGFDAQGAELPVKQPRDDAGNGSEPMAQRTSGSSVGKRSMPGGVESIEIQCPYARSVGIGVDAAGVLHAVAWATDSDASSSAVRDLVVASSWLRDHTDLIAVVLGRRLSSEPGVRHLVLGDGRGALGLAQGELKLHVAVDGTSVLIDLN